jgi:hypothetical protein
MFNDVIAGQPPPKYLSSDNDPLFQFHRWQANLRVLEVEEIKAVPCGQLNDRVPDVHLRRLASA